MRTPEQVAADNDLTNAIERVRAVYYPTSDSGILMEYVVIALTQLVDADPDEGYSAVTMIPRDGGIPLSRIGGLLDYAICRHHKVVQEDDD